MTVAAIDRRRSPQQVTIHLEGIGAESILTGLLSLAGGAVGLEAFKRWANNRRQKEVKSLDLTAQIVGWGDELHQRLLDETRELRQSQSLAIERAHQAELKLAITQAELQKLTMRLERKDERLKVLRRLCAENSIAVPLREEHEEEP